MKYINGKNIQIFNNKRVSVCLQKSKRCLPIQCKQAIQIDYTNTMYSRITIYAMCFISKSSAETT